MALNKPRPNVAPWGEYVPNMGFLTIDEFEKLPDEDGWTFELYQGRMIRMPGPGGEHAAIQSVLLWMLMDYIRPHKLGKLFGTGCYYFPQPDGDSVLCPDISYIVPERVASITYRGSYLSIVPDLVIEISSPNDYRPETVTKVQAYLDAGVRMVWIVWPSSKRIDVWRPENTTAPIQTLSVSDILEGLDVIPGFRLPVQDIFS